MTTTAPTIRIRDSNPKKQQDRTPQQATTAEVQRVHRRLAALEQSYEAQITALEASLTRALEEQRQLLENIPQHQTRRDVLKLITDPEKYEVGLLPAEFYSRVRADVKYFERYAPADYDYEEQPALARISWLAGGEIHGLNPTEVHQLKQMGHVVHESQDEMSYNRQSPYYTLWLAKEPTNLWITLRQDDVQGLSWCYCAAKHIRDVRNQDKVRWAAIAPASATYLNLSPDEDESTNLVAMLRESQTVFMMDSRIKGTLPWEIRTDSGVQAALSRLRDEGVRTLQQEGLEYETEIKSARAQLDLEAVGRIAVVS